MNWRTTLYQPIGLSLSLSLLIAVSAAAQSGDPASWRHAQPEQPATLLVTGATVWTSGPAGNLENADLLIEKGKIVKVGQGLSAPAGAVTIDATGKHVTAGLIDAHSHSYMLGGVNEGSNITTAEVRVRDIVDPESINIYRQLAGGLTTANLLHGSANSIGGQNAVVKLRWGSTADEMMMAEAPEGIKFALGENPKQSNWQAPNPRYPQTRQGVEQSIRERFLAARDYRAAWQTYRKAGGAKSQRVPPKRDLQLDAIVEIMEGKRLVHSHSYRADEILMLLEAAEEFGFKVASLQHVLEGYKVADEIAAHGAGASTFSDWWAYKFEVIDAIPYNGAIMWDRDVVVSFNSDDNQLARRLNLEAAKAVRYGNVPEAEALKFVTLNPALQLGIDKWVGSLEAGKHADFAIWSGHPLSTFSVCEQTWVDGRKYFDRQADLDDREALANERRELIAAIEAESASDEEAEGNEEAAGGEEPASSDAPPTGEAPPDPGWAKLRAALQEAGR